MSGCREYRLLASAALDEALAPGDQARLDAHLAACPACRLELAELRWTRQQVRALEPIEAPPWLASRVMARVREEAARPSFWHRVLRPLARRPELQVAGLLLLGAAGFYLWKTRVPQPISPGPPAPAPRMERGPESRPAGPPARDRALPQRPRPPVQRPEAALPAPSEPLLDREAGYAPAPRAKEEKKRLETPVAQESFPAAPLASEAPGGRALKAAPPRAGAGCFIRLEVEDPDSAAAWIEGAASGAGAAVLARGERRLTLRLEAGCLPDLVGRLARIGRVVERPRVEGGAGPVTVSIQW